MDSAEDPRNLLGREEGQNRVAPYESPCPVGCIFSNGKLFGDCRSPESKECFLRPQEDPRNLVDEFKYFPVDVIRARLAERRRNFATLILNIDYDLNIATLVRTHNAFCGKEIFYLGRRKYNRRGAVGAYIYENLTYFGTLEEAVEKIPKEYTWVGIDNRPGSVPLPEFEWPEQPLLLVGHEKGGLDFLPQLPYHCKAIVSIPQAGSVRSLNVGVAAGIAIYDLCTKKGWLK